VEERRSAYRVWWRNPWGKYHFEDINAEGVIILKRICK